MLSYIVYANTSKSSFRTQVSSFSSDPLQSSDTQVSETITVKDNCRGINEDFNENHAFHNQSIFQYYI